jgi:FkbM family methyltransferase
MLPESIRKFSCNPVVRGVASRLHVAHFARRVYCKLLSGNGELQASFLGVDAVFRTKNSKQLAFIDYILTTEGGMIEAALSDLKPGDAFLDVGSHYGIFSVLASKLVGPNGRVIAVEPHDESLEALQKNLAANACKNVRVVSAALTDKTGPFPMVCDVNFAVPAYSSDSSAEIRMALGIAGDEALDGEPVPAVIKVDVEGHELAALRGLRTTLSNPMCRRLCLEVHPPLLPQGVSEKSIMDFIGECGLKVSNATVRNATVHVIAVR